MARDLTLAVKEWVTMSLWTSHNFSWHRKFCKQRATKYSELWEQPEYNYFLSRHNKLCNTLAVSIAPRLVRNLSVWKIGWRLPDSPRDIYFNLWKETKQLHSDVEDHNSVFLITINFKKRPKTESKSRDYK